MPGEHQTPTGRLREGKIKKLLRPVPLTEERFAPYGVIIRGGIGAASFERPFLQNWRLPFESDAPARLQIMRYRFRTQMVFSKLERHLFVTEMRCAIGAEAAVLIVGGKGVDLALHDRPNATNGSHKDEVPPTVDSVSAFIMDGSAGVMFHPGIWHGLDCYPLTPPHADFLFFE